MSAAGSHLLDTNIVIALFAGEETVLHRLATATQFFVPSIVLGELYYGARNSGRTETNIARIDVFAATNTVLICNTTTAQHYGQIKHQLRMKGRPIPENDLWIAAITVQHQLTLVSRDDHFSEIGGLLTETW